MSLKIKAGKLLLLVLTIGLLPLPLKAQDITADGTTATNVNTLDNSNFDINGGDRAGGNLFHSFGDFSVPTAGSANFLNSPDVENIINRVTGGNLSNIDGLISANGSANVFLLNPAGIVFGPNSSLNIGGSFLGSTADSLIFNDGTEFNATQTTKPLLTINAPIGLNIRDNPAPIVNQSISLDSKGNFVGLQVNPGKNLGLIGGDINFDGGIITAPGGLVELGGLATAGTILYNNDGGFIYPDGITRSNVSFTNLGEVNVAGFGGGYITVNADNLEILEGSRLLAGIKDGFGTIGIQAGDITLNTNKLVISGENNSGTSLITNRVGSPRAQDLKSAGNTGNIFINTQTLEGRGSFLIGSATYGNGDAGKISIAATEKIDLNGLGIASGISSIVGNSGVGNAGDLTITTPSLSLSNFSSLVTSTLGIGNAGNIQINVSDSLALNGGSQIQAVGFNTATGNSGTIDIDAQTADLTFDDVLVGSFTANTGIGGDINIKGRSLSLTKTTIFNDTLEETALDKLPNAGNINIDIAENITLQDASSLRSNTFGAGNAGNVTINAGEVLSLDNSRIESAVRSESATGNGGTIALNSNSLSLNNSLIGTSTFGKGDAGNIHISAIDSVNLSGSDRSQIQAASFNTATGNAGNITIDAQTADLNFDNAMVSTTVESTGIGGDINITGKSLSLSNTSIASETSGQTALDRLPNAGNINVNIAEDLSLKDGSLFGSNTFGAGNAGNITVNAGKVFSLDNSRLTSGVLAETATGKGGTIAISSGSLNLDNRSTIGTSTFGKGNAGNIQLTVNDGIAIANNSSLQAAVAPNAVANAGSIDITTKSLDVVDNGNIFATTFGVGNAGNINIDASGNISLRSTQPERSSSSGFISSNVGFNATGNGGQINIKANSLSLDKISSISTNVFGTNTITDGNFEIFRGVGNAGNINIDLTNSLLVANGANITSNTGGRGNAGNITIRAKENVTLDGFRTSLSETGISSDVEFVGIGKGGNVDIEAKNLTLKGGAAISTETFGQGNAGNIKVNTSNSIKIDSGLNTDAEGDSVPNTSSGLFSGTLENAQGRGGSIEISTNRLQLSNSAAISARTKSAFSGGNIAINANTADINGGSQILTSAFSTGNAGNIDLNVAEDINISGNDITYLQRRFDIDNVFTFDLFETESAESGIFASLQFGAKANGGTINVTAKNLNLLRGGSIAANTSGTGNAGNINIDVRDKVNISGFSNVPLNGNNVTLASNISSQVLPRARGNGGSINIKAGSLEMSNLSYLAAATFGNGNAGNINLEVKDGVTLNNVSTIRNNVESGGVGKAGNIDLKARSLTIKNGAAIQAGIFRPNATLNLAGGKGEGGDIRINTTDFVDISGFSEVQYPVAIPTIGFSSGIFADTSFGAQGKAGNISVTTGDLRLTNGGILQSSTFNSGNAGNIDVTAKTFTATGGGKISTTTSDTGKAGNINLNVSDRIFIAGSDPTLAERNAQIQKDDPFAIFDGGEKPSSGLFANTSDGSTGNGGSITVSNPQEIIIYDGGTIDVDSKGKGSGGKLLIQANNITLDTNASLSASTASKDGGNIDINFKDILRLRNNSNISAQASGNANGGNININGNFIVAYPNQNNDIIAKAEQGKGGNISIDSEAIFGIQPRNATLGNTTNDIDASSDFGLQGNISINTPDVNPAKNREQTPDNVVEPEETVAQACSGSGSGNSSGNSFTISGRGGLPPSPTETLESDLIKVSGTYQSQKDLTIEESQKNEDKEKQASKVDEKKPMSSDEIVPARGVAINEKGQIVLTAYPTPDVSDRSANNSNYCNNPVSSKSNPTGYTFSDDYLLGFSN
jgi:filamentous hemagglutinin family protein